MRVTYSDKEVIPCRTCGVEKPRTEYRSYQRPSGHTYVNRACRECLREYDREWHKRNRRKALAKMRNNELIRRYGITQKEFDSTLQRQGAACAICGTAKPSAGTTQFCVDHDHSTGKIRGILCSRCNVGLGKFCDNVKLLSAAIGYLNANRKS